jgi:DNA anti-recombination protein RmuC
MKAMTKNWTDERLEERFDRIDQRFDAIDQRFDAIDQRFEEVDRRFAAVDQRFDRLEGELRTHRLETKTEIEGLRREMGAFQRTMLQLGGGMIVTFAVGFASLILTQL